MIFTEREFWQVARQPATLRRSVKVALVVGTILNLINQSNGIFGAAEFHIVQALLTYCVPFCVSTYAASVAEIERRFEDRKAQQGEAPLGDDS